MPTLPRKPLAILAGAAVVFAAPAALQIIGKTPKAAASSSAGSSSISVPSNTGLSGVGTASSSKPDANIFPRMGLNMVSLSYFTRESPFLNRFKLGGLWSVRGENVDPKMLNANGWPIAMPASGQHWEANIPLDDVTTGNANLYIVRWDGTGSVSIGLAGKTITTDHRILVQNVRGMMLVDVDATDPKDPVRNIAVVRYDQQADFYAGKIFNPEFLDRVVKPFSSFRTMDWDLINNSEESNWSDRQKPADAMWTRMPIEEEVALANEGGVDLWKTIPAKATDDYVRQLLTYIHANLKPGLKVHLEYSNEVWNGSFTQNAYAAAQTQKMWGNMDWAASVYYAYRAAQIANIGWGIFGKDSTQFRPVLGGWYGWSGPEMTDAMAKGVKYLNAGSISTIFREYAIAPYFGDALGAGPGNEADRAIVLQWAKDPTGAGLDKAFQQLAHGGLLGNPGTSLDDAKFGFEPKHAAFARANNLSMVAYEGGLAFYYFMAAPESKPYLTDFFKKLVADPRMAQLYTRWAQDFANNGGTLMEAYNDVGSLGEFGPWGALPSLTSPDTPRYSALRDAATQGKADAAQ